MKTRFDDHWPVCYRNASKEAERRGEDNVRFEHWFWFAALFALIVIAPAVVEFLA